VKIHVATWHHLRLAISGPAVSPRFWHCGAFRISGASRLRQRSPRRATRPTGRRRCTVLTSRLWLPTWSRHAATAFTRNWVRSKCYWMGDLLDATRDGLKWFSKCVIFSGSGYGVPRRSRHRRCAAGSL